MNMRIYRIILLLFLIVCIGLLTLDVGRDIKAERELKISLHKRYESLINANGKGILNQKALEGDHDLCVRFAKEEKSACKAAFPSSIALHLFFIYLCVFALKNADRYSYYNDASTNFSKVGLIFLIIASIVVTPGRLVRKYEDVKKEYKKYEFVDESYKYIEVNIKNKKKELEPKSDGYNHDVWNVYLDDGSKIDVGEAVFANIKMNGKYILAQTEKSGKILSAYPETTFELEK